MILLVSNLADLLRRPSAGATAKGSMNNADPLPQSSHSSSRTGQDGADTYSNVTNRNGAPASASKSRAAAAASDATADSDATSPAFVGVEHHLLGLSPQYWAHTPLLIGDILSLGLVNGVDCMMSASPHSPEHDEQPDPQICLHNNQIPGRKRRRPSEDSEDDKVSGIAIDHIIPISRCEIVGFIVSKERKANSTLYLLDDGSGMIDCISWEDDVDGTYSLPPLIETYPNRNDLEQNSFRVGDCVRIRGKIKCISIGSESRTIDISVVGDNTISKGASSRHTQRFEVPVNVVREIVVATMEHVLDPNTSNGIDPQTTHWLKCIHFARRIGIQSDADAEPIRNGADVLGLLGNTMSTKLTGANVIDIGEEDNGAWRVFGPDCNCRLPHKDELLYCHCLAKFEALDPQQVFRDALLKHLLEMMEKDSTNPLRFHYGSLQEDEHLHGIAAKTVSETTNPDINVRRLYFNTFKALRNDGIIHLDDQDADIYLLISKSNVLVPYLAPLVSKEASALEKSMRRANAPPFVKKVPATRLRFVTKCLLANSKKSPTEKTP